MYNTPYSESRPYNSSTDLRRPSEFLDYSLPLSEIEAQLFEAVQPGCQESISDYLDEVSTARTRWACISAKSQRSAEPDVLINLETFESVTKLSYHYPKNNGAEPPSREGKNIQGFSARSRQRMMDRMRRMKKEGLGLPYFVTLTYRENFQDFERAKKHLNAFHQRFRRIGEYRYFWKMEPQERGAIHFHLMMFLPDEMFPDSWQKMDSFERIEYARIRISTAWNEITGQDKFTPERTKNGQKYGNIALMSGTNVRNTYNWRMARGYLYSYMKKEIDLNSWKQEKFQISSDSTGRYHYQKIQGTACKKVTWGLEETFPNTGRFWGFSSNFEFDCYFRNEYTLDRIDQVERELKEICLASWNQYLKYCRARKKQLEKKFSGRPKELQIELSKLISRMKKQRARTSINLEKIRKGRQVQVEISQSLVREIVETENNFHR
jgi:hypothetical protein